MPAKRIPKAPNIDGVAFVKPLRAEFPITEGPSAGQPRTVYGDPLPNFLQWARGDGKFEGTGVRDTVNANAEYLDEVKEDVDGLVNKVQQLTQKVAALEGQPVGNPFVG